MNEELATVNSRLQNKIAELERSNNELSNLLGNTDISTRVQAEQRLRESETRLKEMNKLLEEHVAERTAELARRAEELQALAANVPAMFSYVDAGERYRYVNRLYELQHRLTAEQILGKSVHELLGAKNYAVAKPHIDKALAGETDRYEATFDFPEGAHTMDVLYVPEKDSEGGVKGFYTLVHDITERKMLERKLRDSERRVRAIVNAAGDAIITVDPDGIVRDYNPAAERIFGRSAAAVIGQDARLLLPPSCRTCANYPACFCLGQCPSATQRPQELLGRRRDGILFPMEVTVSEIDDGALSVAVVRDISERKDLEREVIEVSTAEQERIGRDIHDGIGQQLTALTMLAASIERKLTASGHPAEAKEVGGLVDHLRNTLAEARSLANGLSPVGIDPEGLMDAISGLTDRACKSSTTDCRFTADPGIKISCENLAVHLYRIAQEALHNALRHAQPRKIEVRLTQEGPDLVLSIYDDGTGFLPAQEQHAGLGLHIMRYRAGILGGQLTIDCPREGGTLVTCRCPTTREVPGSNRR